jgi:pimeloyl-ACP methyl ester carboxylesterase
MPNITLRDTRIYYDDVGQGPETLVFVHGLMLASESWQGQRDALRSGYRIITFDLRGQGRSEHPEAGLDLDSLAEDTAALITALRCGPCHLVGFSMGSFVALRVAARHAALVRSLTLIGPSADAEEPQHLPRYARLIRWVRLLGPRPFTGALMKILFGDSFLQDPVRASERGRWRRYVQALPRDLYRAAAASAGRAAITGELARIQAPTLVVSGDEDRPISPARARAVHEGIRGSRFVAFAATGHAVMLEQPAAFNALLRAFVQQHSLPVDAVRLAA